MFVQSTFEAVRHRAISVTRWVVEGGPCHPRCSGEGTPLSRELCRVTGTRTPGSLVCRGGSGKCPRGEVR